MTTQYCQPTLTSHYRCQFGDSPAEFSKQFSPPKHVLHAPVINESYGLIADNTLGRHRLQVPPFFLPPTRHFVVFRAN